MLDTTTREGYQPPQQDVGQPICAPTPSGCRLWYVVATKPQAERRAYAALHLKGYQPYLPLITIRRRDRSYHTRPLFPGYLFTHLDPAHPWYPIRYAPGVWHLITVDGTPSPCAKGAVEALQALEAEWVTPRHQNARLAPGTPVAVGNGMFQDVPAVILSVGKDMALVSLMMFGHLREVAVSVDCLSARDE